MGLYICEWFSIENGKLGSEFDTNESSTAAIETRKRERVYVCDCVTKLKKMLYFKVLFVFFFFIVQYSVFEGSTFDLMILQMMFFLCCFSLFFCWCCFICGTQKQNKTKVKRKIEKATVTVGFDVCDWFLFFYFYFVWVCVWITDWFTAVWNELGKVNPTVWCGPLVQIQKKNTHMIGKWNWKKVY